MRTLTIIRKGGSSVALLLILCGIPLIAPGAASTTLGSSDALRCYEESMLVTSDVGIPWCDRAIMNGDLTRRDLAATYSNRGLIQAGNGRYRKAIEDHSKALQILPTLGQAYINRGNAYYHSRDFTAALADYDRAMELGAMPQHIPHYNRALTLLRLGRKDDARRAFQAALALVPDSVRIRKQLDELENL